MNRRLYVYDPRVAWATPPVNAATRRGWSATFWSDRSLIGRYDLERPGYALLFVHAHPDVLPGDRDLARQIEERDDVKLITDLGQIECYENKRHQTELYDAWMPDTWVETTHAEAELAVLAYDFDRPLVSKADVGASSYNVRVLRTREEAFRHVAEVFGPGVPVRHCAGGRDATSLQRGYVILQRFVPHEVTYRVNAVGNQRAIFKRYCYPDRPVAQTGNVAPVAELDGQLESLLGFADAVFRDMGTRWCAIDVLWDEAEDAWMLLECSQRWPHPSPGECDTRGRFFRWISGRWLPGRTWGEMWEALLDELEAGTWDDG